MGEQGLVFVELFDGGFIGDGEDDLVAPFFGLSEFPYYGARGGFGEGFVVTLNVFGVGEFAGSSGDASEEF